MLMLQEDEEGESLSEQLEKLLAKYVDPDGPQDAIDPWRGTPPPLALAGWTWLNDIES